MSQLIEETEPSDKKIKLDFKVEVKLDSNGNSNEETTSNSEQIETTTPNLISGNFVSDNKNEENAEQPISKSRKKKLLKLAKWEIKKIEKRKQEREKQRLKKQEAREKGVPYRTGPSRKSLKHIKMANSSCCVTVAIDLSFDHLMIDKDIAKVVKQLLRTYTLNRRALNPMQLCFTGLKKGGKMHAAMSKHDGYNNWDIRIEEQPFTEIYPHSNICYLTSESENVLESLDPNTVYIIGGLVDHNAHKGLCYELAKEKSLRHAQLPLEKLLLMKTRRVLTIDHVFEILLRVTEGKTWTDALLEVLPMRKGAKPVENKIDTIENNIECN